MLFGLSEAAKDLIQGGIVFFFEFLRGGVDEDGAFGDDDDARADGFDFFKNVSRENDALVLGHLLDELADVMLLVGIEAVRGFVKDKDVRVVDDGLGKADPAPVALGECFDGLVVDGFDGAEADSTVNGVASRLALLDVARITDELEEGSDGHFVVGGCVFGEVADGFSHAEGVFEDVVATNGGGTGVGGEEAGEHFHGGAFSGAVGAEEAEDLAFFDLEGDAVDGGNGAETAAEVVYLDGSILHRVIP